jgi:hypothetical protein
MFDALSTEKRDLLRFEFQMVLCNFLKKVRKNSLELLIILMTYAILQEIVTMNYSNKAAPRLEQSCAFTDNAPISGGKKCKLLGKTIPRVLKSAHLDFLLVSSPQYSSNVLSYIY